MNATENLTFEPDYFEAKVGLLKIVEKLTGQHRTFSEEGDKMLDSLLENLKDLGLHERRYWLDWNQTDQLIIKNARLARIRSRLKNLGSAPRPSFEYMLKFYQTGKDPEHRIMHRPVRKNNGW